MNYSGNVTVTAGTTSYIGDNSGGAGLITIGGALTGSGTLNKIGTLVVSLSGATSGFSGTWLATGAATAFLGNATGSTAAVFNVNGSGYNINNSGTVNFGALGGNTGTIQNGIASTSSTLSVGALGTNTTFGGTLANGSGTLTLNKVGAGNLTLSGAIPSPGPVVVTSGALVVTGNLGTSPPAVPVTIAGGTLQVGTATANGAIGSPTTGAISAPITNNGTLYVVNPSAQAISAPISGSGALVKNGAGTLTLTAPMTYGGTTLINAGALKLGSTAISGFGGSGTGWALNNNGIDAPTVSGNTLTLTYNGVGSIANTAWYATPVNPASGFTTSFTYTSTVGGNSSVADGVCFILQNSPAGTTALGGGGGSFGYETSVTKSVGINLNLYTVSQEGYAVNGSVSDVNLPISNFLSSGDPINVAVNYSPSTQILAWNLTDPITSTTYNFSQSGVNLATILGGSSAYVGFTGADGGVSATQVISNFNYTQAVNYNDSLPTGTALTMAASSTLDLSGNTQTVGSLAGAGTVTSSLAVASTIFAAGGNNSSTTFSGVLSNGSGTMSVVKQGTGSWTLASNNPYSGATTISGGTLQVGNGGAAGTIGSGSVLNNGVLAFNRSDAALTISAPIGGSGAVYQAGSGTTTLAANNTYGGGTVINNGTIQVGNGGSTGSLGAGPIANNGAVIFNRGDSAVFANALSGTGAVYQVGGVLQSSQGSVALAGNASSYTGPITVTNGNLYVNSSNGASSIAVGPGPATFILGGSGSANSATATVADANGSPSGIEAGYNGQGSLTLYGLNFQNTGNVYVNNIGQYSSTAGINVTGSNQLNAQGNSTSIVFNLGGRPQRTLSPRLTI